MKKKGSQFSAMKINLKAINLRRGSVSILFALSNHIVSINRISSVYPTKKGNILAISLNEKTKVLVCNKLL